MRVGPFWREVGHPPHSIDESFVMTILPADSGSFQVRKYNFVIERGGTCLKKSLKSAGLNGLNVTL